MAKGIHQACPNGHRLEGSFVLGIGVCSLSQQGERRRSIPAFDSRYQVPVKPILPHLPVGQPAGNADQTDQQQEQKQSDYFPTAHRLFLIRSNPA